MDSEDKLGLKSNSVRSGQPTSEACDDNLDARIYVASIKFILMPIYLHLTNACNNTEIRVKCLIKGMRFYCIL